MPEPTAGQQWIIDLADRVAVNTRDAEAVSDLQLIAGVDVDGLYGPVTAGIVSFIGGEGPPLPRAGFITPYEVVEGSAMEAYLDGLLISACQLKTWLGDVAGIVPPVGGWDPVSEEALRSLVTQFDADPEFRSGLVGGVEHVQILPGPPPEGIDSVAVTAGVWFRELSAAYATPCAAPAVAVAGSDPAVAAVPFAPRVIQTTTSAQPAPESPLVPPPTPVGASLLLAQSTLPGVKHDTGIVVAETFQAPTFQVTVPEERKVPAWVWAVGGVAVVGAVVAAVVIGKGRRRRRRR